MKLGQHALETDLDLGEMLHAQLTSLERGAVLARRWFAHDGVEYVVVVQAALNAEPRRRPVGARSRLV